MEHKKTIGELLKEAYYEANKKIMDERLKRQEEIRVINKRYCDELIKLAKEKMNTHNDPLTDIEIHVQAPIFPNYKDLVPDYENSTLHLFSNWCKLNDLHCWCTYNPNNQHTWSLRWNDSLPSGNDEKQEITFGKRMGQKRYLLRLREINQRRDENKKLVDKWLNDLKIVEEYFYQHIKDEAFWKQECLDLTTILPDFKRDQIGHFTICSEDRPSFEKLATVWANKHGLSFTATTIYWYHLFPK